MTEHSGATLALLIRLKDKREYLVPQDNLLQLIEFTKTFNAEIYRVSTKKPEAILKLEQLPEALCNMQYRLTAPYSDLGRIVPLGTQPTILNKVPPPTPLEYTRMTVRQRRAAIRQAIRERFLAHETVTLNDLCEEFEDQNLSRGSMTNHLAIVRNRLTEEGFIVQRVGVGAYRLGGGNTMFNSFSIPMPRISSSEFRAVIPQTTARAGTTLLNSTGPFTFNWGTAGPSIEEAISEFARYNGGTSSSS